MYKITENIFKEMNSSKEILRLCLYAVVLIKVDTTLQLLELVKQFELENHLILSQPQSSSMIILRTSSKLNFFARI